MKPDWTEQQQQVIGLKDRNILVSAAAGSGKTAVLVERIIQKVTEETDACDIDRLLVVTFTKAAAAEMRTRIGSALEEKLQQHPGNEHLQRQASLLHTAQITTIDSFCQNIIRNYFHVIDLDAAFRVGDETELKIMKNDILQKLLEEKYAEAREKKNENFLRFTDAFSVGRTDSTIEELIFALFDIANSYPWPEEWLQDCAALYQLKNIEELEGSEWNQKLTAYLRRCIKSFLKMAQQAEAICMEADGPAAYREAIQSDIILLKQLENCTTYTAFAEGFRSFQMIRLKAIRGKEISPEKKEAVKRLRNAYGKEGISKLRERYFFQSAEEMLQDIQAMAPLVQELVSLTIAFQKAFSAGKREEGIIDFSDMEHFALDILVTKDENGIRASETALELQDYYDEILTDEYQDSNYVQELILTSLCRAPEQKPYLFMVGDVKQSIYKFRLARPELFMQKYDSYTIGHGPYQRIDLHQNFRSRPDVLEAANAIFSQIMQKDFGGIVYDDSAKLVPGAVFADSSERTASGTDIILIESQGEDDALEKKPLEAAAIGEKIKSLVQGEQPLQIWDKTGYRPVRYRDIVILLRSLTGWSEEFIETLGDMGIPAYAETKTGYFTTLEVETVLNYLYIIDNPRQDIPLTAVLRSVFAGVTDEELAWLGTMPQEVNFWDRLQDFLALRRWQRGEKEAAAVCEERGVDFEKLEKHWCMKEAEAALLEKKLNKLVQDLRNYQKFSSFHSVYELLRRIYDETGYYRIMAAMPTGEKRRANLDILLQQAIEFGQTGQRGIYSFTRYIENLQKSNIDFGEAMLTNENADAVRIMTIHKSKGLEFPVVFVAGMGKQFNLMDARKGTVISGDYGIGCDYIDTELRVRQQTLLKRFLINAMVSDTLAEEIRILYVALTRAKEKLFITGTVKQLWKKLDSWKTQSQFLDYYQLTTARTYLDWLIPAVAKRDAVQQMLCEYLEQTGEKTTYFYGDKDALFRLEFLFPEEIVISEKTERMDSMLQQKRLSEWDTDITYDEQMRQALREQQLYVYPYAGEEKLPVKVSVSELKRREEMQIQMLAEEKEAPTDAVILGNAERQKSISEIPRPKFMQGEQQISPAARGTLYHLVMQHFPYQRLAETDGIWGEKEFFVYLEELVQKGYMNTEEAKLLQVKKFADFAKSAIGKRMAKAAQAGTLYLEQPFMLGVRANEIYTQQASKEIIMVQGIIDAFFYEGKNSVLVDYKTDFVRCGEEKALIKKYQAQLACYARALEQLTGKKVSEQVIYSFALGKEILL